MGGSWVCSELRTPPARRDLHTAKTLINRILDSCLGFAERATVLRLHTRGRPLGVESHAGENRILDNGYEKRASPRETAQGCVLNGYPCRYENVAFRINVLRTVRAWGYQFN